MTPFSALSPPSEWQLSVVVAWICILPEEYDSARLLFDQRYNYEDKGIVPDYNDDNRYELGRIGNHEVVMNCPTGSMGHYNAQRIVTKMLGTFPNIRAALLVGIGGGVPNLAGQNPAKHVDIRLGDVVVSSRIISYESGKMTDKGLTDVQPAFEPETNLFAAASDFRSDLRQDERLLQNKMRQAASKPKNAASIYSRPRADHLFVSDYLHNEPCQCRLPQPEDQSLLVPRQHRLKGSLVKMHIGCVGSADQLLKSAHKRDALSETHGIICVEMEAAAVMRGNCITVRGISDYCDGHKNDSWHDYAALSAAVCAKELLQRTSPSRFKLLQRHMTPHECYSLVRDVIHRLRNELAHNLQQKEDVEALSRTLAVIDSRAGFLKDYARDNRFHAAGHAATTAEQSREAEEMAANIEILQQDLKRLVREIQSKCERRANADLALTRKQSDKLKAKVNATAKEVDGLKYSIKALETTASTFRQAVDLDGDERYGKANELLERIPQILGDAYTFATATAKVTRPTTKQISKTTRRKVRMSKVATPTVSWTPESRAICVAERVPLTSRESAGRPKRSGPTPQYRTRTRSQLQIPPPGPRRNVSRQQPLIITSSTRRDGQTFEQINYRRSQVTTYTHNNQRPLASVLKSIPLRNVKFQSPRTSKERRHESNLATSDTDSI